MKPIISSLLFLCLSLSIFSQDADSTTVLREDALKIFLDCSWNCDLNYIRNEIDIVNYVRDVKDADLYIRVAFQNTGSGGDKVTLFYEGQGDYEGQKYEMAYDVEAVSTNDEQRKQMVDNLRAGMMPFIAQTPLFESVNISIAEKKEEEEEELVEDKWNSWLYRIGVNGWFNGQSNYKSINLWGNISATKVTEEWKIRLSVSGDLNRDRFVIGYDSLSNPEFFLSETNGYGFYSYAIRGINDHWSVGGSYDVEGNSYSNIRLGHDLSAAVEYNLFPYEEANEQQLRIAYQPGFRYNSYSDTTIYNKKSEFLGRHRISIAYSKQAKWGSVSASLTSAQYLHDPSLYNIRLRTGLNIRVVRGLQFNLSGNIGLIRDQISLLKGGASEEEILTQQRELATDYSYWGNFGISYSFGSIYNNVVFPRFGGGI